MLYRYGIAIGAARYLLQYIVCGLYGSEVVGKVLIAVHAELSTKIIDREIESGHVTCVGIEHDVIERRLTQACKALKRLHRIFIRQGLTPQTGDHIHAISLLNADEEFIVLVGILPRAPYFIVVVVHTPCANILQVYLVAHEVGMCFPEDACI